MPVTMRSWDSATVLRGISLRRRYEKTIWPHHAVTGHVGNAIDKKFILRLYVCQAAFLIGATISRSAMRITHIIFSIQLK